MTTFGDILQNIGEFGTFQKLIICALSFPNMILGFEFACVFFIQSDPERHCNTDWILEFDLVCDRANLLQVAQTVMMSGILLGCLLFGPFAESFGRKRTLFFFGAVLLTSPVFRWRCLANVMNPLCFSVLTATEWIGASKRSWGVAATQLCGAVGQAVLAGLIYVVRDWRVAQLITAALLGVIVVYIWFLPESARWLLERGRTEEAKELLFKVASINKRRFSETLLEKVLRRTCYPIPTVPTSFNHIKFSVNVAYYCISFNVGNFGLDVFLTQLIFGVTEIPVHLVCVWLLEALGRRVSFISTLLVGGVLCMLILTFNQGNNVAVTVLATSGRFIINWAGTICNVYVQELFPTSCRQTASGVGSIASRAGGLIAPLVNMLAMYHWSIPVISFSGLTLLSGGLCFILPETRGKELPDSFDEAESNRSTISRKYDPIAIDRCYVHACYLLTTKLYSLSRDLNGLHNNDVLQSLITPLGSTGSSSVDSGESCLSVDERPMRSSVSGSASDRGLVSLLLSSVAFESCSLVSVWTRSIRSSLVWLVGSSGSARIIPSSVFESPS
uniref:Solute carrier family 22 member 13a n=1 Tax=Hippocampus comes TaxID=109280 RepID=A0A3Q2YGJ8_HIPCM